MENSFGMSLLLDAALKSTLVLLAATALMVVLRRGSAASRHLVWQFAVIAVLGLPVVKVVSPLRLPLLPQWRSPIVRTTAEPAQVIATPSLGSSPEIGTRNTERMPDQAVGNATTSTPPATSAAQASPAATTSWTVRVLRWIALAWVIVASVLALRLLLGFVLVRWFALRAYPLYEEGWAELNDELSAAIGLRRSVSLFASPHVATPMTWGILHPVVMMPSAAEDWSTERRRVVLLHELAHVQRRDSLTHMVAQVACAVYWFHPLVWKATTRMRAEAERACDDLVLRAGTKASVYADHLLELIRTIGGMRTPALALPMAQRSTFEGRLLAILEPHLDRTTPRRLSVAGMVVAAGLVVFPLAGLTTASQLSSEQRMASAKQLKSQHDDAQNDAASDAETSQETQHEIGQADVPGAAAAAVDQVMQNIAGLSASSPANVVLEAWATANSVSTYQSNTSRTQTSSSSSTSAHLAVGALARALTDESVDVRLAAAQSLGEIEDSIAIAALANALRTDADAKVRKMAAWALGNIESKAGVPALVHALRNDRDIEVRRTALWALGEIEDGSAVDAVSAVIGDADAQIRSLAVWALGQIEDRRAVPALLNVLKSSDVEARRQAVWALGQIEDASAVAGLAAALHDSDAQVRDQAVWALGEIESPQAVGPLSALINDPNPDTRKQVAWALGQIEDAGAVPALSTLLREDKVTEVRNMAAWALGEIESAAAVPALAAALKDAAPSVRKQSAWALGQIESRPAPQALLDALKDSDKDVRSTAAWALSQIEDPNSAPALRAALRDGDADVKKAVLHALVSLGDQVGYEFLAEMLKDPDPEVRRAAAAAMGGKSWSNPQPRPQPKPQPRPRPMPQPIR